MQKIKRLINLLLGRNKFNSLNYWERRYAGGGNSGDGSYGRLSEFKADFINKFIADHGIQSAIEMGCGDGHQLSMIHYPSYTGMDVSSTIVELCRQKFGKDGSKRFAVYEPDRFVPDKSMQADVCLSLDVLYHIVEEKYYFKYLEDLFGLSKKFVIVYSTDFFLHETAHVLHRKFTDDVKKKFPGWEMVEHIPNPYPGVGEQKSMADFFVFKKMN